MYLMEKNIDKILYLDFVGKVKLIGTLEQLSVYVS